MLPICVKSVCVLIPFIIIYFIPCVLFSEEKLLTSIYKNKYNIYTTKIELYLHILRNFTMTDNFFLDKI